MPTSLTTTLIQSTILNAISNILAQVIDQHKKNKPFSLNTLALLQFVTYAIIIVPINLIWQKWLENQYPGFPSWKRSATNITSAPSTGSKSPIMNPVIRKSSSDDDIDLLPGNEVLPANEKKKQLSSLLFRPRKKRSGMYNFAMKFVLDQTVGSVLNIVLFIVLINLLKGMGWGRTWELVCEDFTPIMIARLKYRPVVSTLMYTVVSLDRRVVFGSACGVIWGVYLSLYAAV